MSFPGGGEGVMPVAKDGELYCLKWHTFQSHFTTGLRNLFLEGDAAENDVTLAAEGRYIQCHKWLLSLCSPYFKKLFRANSNNRSGNTIVIVNNVKFRDLENLVHFMYNGEVKVATNQELQGFLQAGELLEIEGLTRCTDAGEEQKSRTPTTQPHKSNITTSCPSGSGAPKGPSSTQPGTSANLRTTQSVGEPSTSSMPTTSKVPQLPQQSVRGPSVTKRARYSEPPVSEHPIVAVTSVTGESSSSNVSRIMEFSDGLQTHSIEDNQRLIEADPLAFDNTIEGAGNLDPLGNIGADPLAVDGENVETEEQLMQFESIKSENAEIYVHEGDEDEGDYETSDQGENSGMSEGVYQSGGISVESGATGFNLPGPSSASEHISARSDSKTQGSRKSNRPKSVSGKKKSRRNVSPPTTSKPDRQCDSVAIFGRVLEAQIAGGNKNAVLGLYTVPDIRKKIYVCTHCGFQYKERTLQNITKHIVNCHRHLLKNYL